MHSWMLVQRFREVKYHAQLAFARLGFKFRSYRWCFGHCPFIESALPHRSGTKRINTRLLSGFHLPLPLKSAVASSPLPALPHGLTSILCSQGRAKKTERGWGGEGARKTKHGKGQKEVLLETPGAGSWGAGHGTWEQRLWKTPLHQTDAKERPGLYRQSFWLLDDVRWTENPLGDRALGSQLH